MIEGLWEKANKVSEIGYKIDGLAGISEILSERLMDNAESGAAWALTDMLRMYGEQLENLAQDLLYLNKEHTELQTKGKKK